MKMRPILFSTAMVQAILVGRKTQTRRVVKPRSYITDVVDGVAYEMTEDDSQPINCPYGQPGDILWVRETWCYVMLFHAHDLLEGSRDRNLYVYKTSFHEDWMEYAKEKYGYKWRPSIHMPFAAARIFLRIKSVRVEKLQDISGQDAIHEGVAMPTYSPASLLENWRTAKELFNSLWQSINGPESWNANPWVWVVEFERISREEAGL